MKPAGIQYRRAFVRVALLFATVASLAFGGDAALQPVNTEFRFPLYPKKPVRLAAGESLLQKYLSGFKPAFEPSEEQKLLHATLFYDGDATRAQVREKLKDPNLPYAQKRALENLDLLWIRFDALEPENRTSPVAEYFAASRKKHPEDLGGFGADIHHYSIETPREVIESKAGAVRSGIRVVVSEFSAAETSSGKRGTPVFIMNESKSGIFFEASDSRLPMMLQAWSEVQNKWVDAEVTRYSWCGNSYHHVLLEPGHSFVVATPLLDGDTETKFRVRLLLPDDDSVTSNEFAGRINGALLKPPPEPATKSGSL